MVVAGGTPESSEVHGPLMDRACREADPSTYISYRHGLKAIENQKESRPGPPREPWQLDTHGLYPGLIRVSGPYRSLAWSKLLIEVEEGETTVWELAELGVQDCLR